MCDRMISLLNTITIPGHTIQLLNVSLLHEAKMMGLSNILVEPSTATNIPKYARTFSPVFCDNHTVVQVMNISPTAVTIYGGAKFKEFTPLTELLLLQSPQQQPCQQHLSTIPLMLNIDFTHSIRSPSQQQNHFTLLNDYQNLFASDKDPMGCTGVVRHAINTEGSPIHQPMHC